MKKLIPLLLLMVMLTAGCNLAGISISTSTQPPVISSFSASPASIAAGASSTLSWAVTRATTASIDQGIGNVALSGSRAVTPGTTTVYNLTATNSTGTSTTATTQVIVSGTSTPPTPSGLPVVNYFTANPSSIYAGNSSTLSWNVSNATYVNIDHGVGNVGSSGSTSVWPATSTAFTLTATNAVGQSSMTATVLISGMPSTPSFAVTGVTASVNPPSFTGACPATFNFYAVITANGPGTVTYQWENSKGIAVAPQSINFSSAGSQTVSISYDIGTSGSYWVRLHVLTPDEIISNQASFALSCKWVIPPIPVTSDWSGTWTTTYGTMHLTQTGNQVTGTYDYNNGKIQGTVSGNVLTGTWSEAPTYSPPDHAGDVQLTISSDGKTFMGGWRYDSSGSWTTWKGTTIM
jgi:hypothetical protein